LLESKNAPSLGKIVMATSVLQSQSEEQTLRKLTIAEYHKLVEAGVLHPKERVELLEGV